jgi:transposase-like protein
MNISDEANKLRVDLVRLGTGQLRRRYPAGMKEAILKFVENARAAGVPVEECCRRLGLSAKQVGNWRAAQRAAHSQALVPVQVAEDRARTAGLLVVAPNGYRVEGANVAQVIELMRALA